MKSRKLILTTTAVSFLAVASSFTGTVNASADQSEVNSTASSSASTSSTMNSSSGSTSQLVPQKIVDVVSNSVTMSRWGLKPVGSIEYKESQKFDAQLSVSLKGNLSQVEIDTKNAFKTDKLPDRLDRWLTRVDKTGGQVGQCQEAPKSGWLVALAISIFEELAPVLLKQLDSWNTYRPAKNYHALVYTTQSGDVKKVVFIKRDQLVDDQLVCEANHQGMEWNKPYPATQ